jgi:GDP-4-dehydro-6-deoxy-D-mannose reductase
LQRVEIEIMQVLITGVGGFLGSHLAEFLLAEGLAVYGTVHKDARNVEHIEDKLSLLPCDILVRQQVETTLREVRPDLVFHLAAQSLPVASWEDPETTFKTNVFGTLYLLEAVRKAGISPTIVVACSSAGYGFTSAEEIPIKEEKTLQPASPYGVSKVAADLLARLYWHAYGMKVVRVRPFFVIGPRKVGDVCSDFARGIVEIEKGQSDRLRVGNLEAVRDFLAVRDAVRALWLLAEKGAPGEVYNICSGVGHPVREVLGLLISLATRPIPVEPDPTRLQTADEPVVIGDNGRLRALGWEPQIPLGQSLGTVLDYWRGLRATSLG